MKQPNDLGINLTLGGGGARGAFHLGVLHYIDEKQISINSLSGASIGAIVGASYACGVPAKEQLKIFKDKTFKKVFKFNFSGGSLLQIDTNHPLIGALVPKRRFEDLQIPLHICVFNVSSATKSYINSGALLPPILASSALPLFFAPVEINGEYYVDGGLVDNLPTDCFEQNVVVSNLHPKRRKTFQKGLLKNVKRSLVQAWLYSSKQGLKNDYTQITSPKLFDHSVLKFSNLDTLFELGYDEAKKHFQTNPL
jgi:NTE family protein